VEGCARDGGASNGDRGEDSDRSELAGAADLDLNVFDLGDAGAGGEFEGDGPAGSATRVAEAALDLGGIDFDDDAVDFVTETVTSGFGFFDEGENLLDGRHGLAMRIDAEADGGESVEGFGLLGEEVFAGFGEEEVGVEVETALGDDVGLEGADGSSSVVAGVSGGLEALGFGGTCAFLSLGAEIERGMERMVRTLVVTSSPMVPLPRVRPRWRWAEALGASRNWRAMERPSILNSQT
jgi:hypothetical protein